jgi:hypothetical protein
MFTRNDEVYHRLKSNLRTPANNTTISPSHHTGYQKSISFDENIQQYYPNHERISIHQLSSQEKQDELPALAKVLSSRSLTYVFIHENHLFFSMFICVYFQCLSE